MIIKLTKQSMFDSVYWNNLIVCLEIQQPLITIGYARQSYISMQDAVGNWEVRSRDRIVVSTLGCGRNNPGSNPGQGTGHLFVAKYYKIKRYKFMSIVSIK